VNNSARVRRQAERLGFGRDVIAGGSDVTGPEQDANGLVEVHVDANETLEHVGVWSLHRHTELNDR